MEALFYVPIDDLDLALTLLKPTLPINISSFVSYFEHILIGTSATSPLFDT